MSPSSSQAPVTAGSSSIPNTSPASTFETTCTSIQSITMMRDEREWRDVRDAWDRSRLPRLSLVPPLSLFPPFPPFSPLLLTPHAASRYGHPMPPHNTRALGLERLIARADRLLDRAAQISARFTRWRLVIFIAGVIAAVIPFKLGWYHTGNAALGLFILIFLTVARYHNRLEDRMHRLRLWQAIKRRHLARRTLDWQALPTPPPDQHPSPPAPHLPRRHSMLRLLDTTISSNGRERLATWRLTQPPSPSQWAARQALIKELAGLPRLRDRLVLEASLVGETELDGKRIQAALQVSPGFHGLRPLLLIEAALAVTTLALALWALLGEGAGYWSLSFGAYALLYLMASGGLAPVFGRALSLHDEWDKLGALFRVLEARSYRATPALGRLCAGLTQGHRRPSETVRQLARVSQALSVKAHPLIHLALNAIIPWDLYWTSRLERLHRQVEADLPVWLETLAELESAAALGTFAYLHPGYCWPAPVAAQGNGEAAAVVAQALGHPLIAAGQRA